MIRCQPSQVMCASTVSIRVTLLLESAKRNPVEINSIEFSTHGSVGGRFRFMNENQSINVLFVLVTRIGVDAG